MSGRLDLAAMARAEYSLTLARADMVDCSEQTYLGKKLTKDTNVTEAPIGYRDSPDVSFF